MRRWMTRKGRRDLLALAVLGALTVALSYPLPLHFTTHVPGSPTWAFDEFTFVYNLWWFKHAALDLHTNPLYTEHIFYPLGTSFVLYTYVLYHALVSLPLQPFLPLPAVSNLLLLLATVLSGYGTYLLMTYLLKQGEGGRVPPVEVCWLAAVGAGAFYAFAAPRAIYAALGHYDMVSTQWIPFYALYLVKTVHERSWKNPLMAGLFATLALLCEMIFGVFLALLTLVYVAVALRQGAFRGARRLLGLERMPAWAGLLGKLAALAFAAAVTYAPVLIYAVPELRQGYMLSGWGHADRLSADLLSFVTPTALNPFWGQDWTEHLAQVKEGSARFADVNTVVVGWGLIVLSLLGWRSKGRRAAGWVWGALLSALFSLGPVLQINGQSVFDFDGLQVRFPLPFILLHYLPVVRGNRAPNRFSVLLLLCVAVLAGYGLAWLLGRARAALVCRARGTAMLPLVAAVLVVGALLEHLAVPLPLSDARIPRFYQDLGREEGDFALLTLPLGWRDSFGVLGDESTQVQYYQTAHGKRLIVGNITRHPAYLFAYYRRLPFFRAVTDLELYQEPDEETVRKAREQAADLLYLYDVRYVAANPAVPGRLPYADTRERALAFVREVLPLEPEPVYEEDGLVVYRTVQPPPRRGFRVDLGQEASWMYQGPGWSFDEEIAGASAVWAVEQGATLFFPLREVAPHRLTFRAWPFAFAGAAPQEVTVLVNGRAVGRVVLAPGWGEYTLDIPAEALRYGLNRVAFRFAHLDAPRDVLPPVRAIGTTGVESPVDIDIEVHSAGAEGGKFAYVTVERGRRRVDASAHRRGYNIAVLDPKTGDLLEARGFDTWANPYESQALARFLAQVPEGYIVIAAVQEDGARHLTEEAVHALRSIGAGEDMRGREGQAHAVIGVKGAPPGTALEEVGGPSAYLRLGRNPDSRTLGAAFDWVDLTPAP